MVLTRSVSPADAIASALGDRPEGVEVLSVAPFVGYGTFAAEVATCRIGQDVVRLFCKHTGANAPETTRARGGVSYEASVYRSVLCSTDLPRAGFFGSWSPDANESWLLLEHLDGASPIDQSEHPEDAMIAAARWVGRFHAATSALAGDASSSLPSYDARYYAAWAARTERFAAPIVRDRPWLPDVCASWPAFAAELAAAPRVVVHGEYGPQNVLYRNGTVYPVDWETAAFGAGEIDLAFLTDRWPRVLTETCVAAYRSARWHDGAPKGFDRVLEIARVYTSLRWLGDRRDWTLHPNSTERFDRLERLARRLEMIG